MENGYGSGTSWDEDTQFLLSSLISTKRETKDARRIFQKAKTIAKRKPQVVVSDGLHAYIKAFKKEFFTLRNPRTKHLRKPRFIDPMNNNVVERLQGTIRERDKVMRSMKEEIQTIADGLRNYYNFIRPHQSLNRKNTRRNGKHRPRIRKEQMVIPHQKSLKRGT